MKKKRKAIFIDEATHAVIKRIADKNKRSMGKQLAHDYES